MNQLINHGKLIILTCVFFLVFPGTSPLQAYTGTPTNLTAQPRFAPGVFPLIFDHQYIHQHAAPAYWRLSPYYIAQRNETSCSLASATMIVNAARSNQTLLATEELATQDNLLKRVDIEAWSKAVAPDGDGATLDQFSVYLAVALKKYGVPHFIITTFHVNDTSKATAMRLHQALLNMEQTGKSLIIANFDLKFFTGTTGGHISPVAAYDAEKKRVLIMDVYRFQLEPYWVPEKLFLQGMATRDKDASKNRGYVVVSLP